MKKIITLILSISMMFAFDINSPENQEKIEYYRNILSENDFNKLISSMSSENLKAEKTEYNKKIQEIKNKQKQARRNNQNSNSSSNRDQFIEFQLDLYDAYGDTWNGSTIITLNRVIYNIEIHIDWNMGFPYINFYTSEGWTTADQCDGNETHQKCTIFLPADMSDPNIADFIYAELYSSGYWAEERGFTFSYQDQLLFGAVGDMGFPSEAEINVSDDWFGSEYVSVGYSLMNGMNFYGDAELYSTSQYYGLFNAEDCAGIVNGPNQVDECGVCDDNPTNDNSTCLDECGIPNGDNSSCADCQGTPNGDAWVSDCGCVAADNSGDDCDDQCGVPNGDNSSCADCQGTPNGDAWVSDCGCVAADNSGDDCDDQCGVPNGDNSTCTDECGVINGNSNPLDCNNDGMDDSCEDEFGTGITSGYDAGFAEGFLEGQSTGDVNNDGQVNVTDVVTIVQLIILGWSEEE